MDYHRLVSDGRVDNPLDKVKVATEFPTATPDTLLEQPISIAANASIPIAVIDKQNRIVVIIPRERLLEDLAP